MSSENIVNRRSVLLGGVSAAAGAGALSQISRAAKGRKKKKRNRRSDSRDGHKATPLRFEKFSVEMPVPPVKQPISVGDTPPFSVGNVFHGVAPEYFTRRGQEHPDIPLFKAFPDKYYEMRVQESHAEIIPGVSTPILGYDGQFPGPTFEAYVGQPVIVRTHNDSDHLPLSTHLHGGHTPSHSDGFPNFYILPFEARDYFYPNCLPLRNGQPDFTHAPSTLWYHDHAMDIAAETVNLGLAGFYLLFDELELELIDRNILPARKYDIPVAIQDRRFNSDGSFFFDPLDHNGTIGDIYVVNGKAFPTFPVERRKYRFRFLNGCNARHMELRLSTEERILGIGSDTHMHDEAFERETLLMVPATRADVVIDFSDAPPEVYLENILVQEDGRGPKGKLFDRDTEIPGTQILKFEVQDGPRASDNASIRVGTQLRPFIPNNPDEVVATRVFEFERRKGAWQINHQFFDENFANAIPKLGTMERWILKNGSGGWWHPIHVHLESHQLVKIEGRTPPRFQQNLVDTTMLGPGSEAEILIKFRTFQGPFVFHCHTIEHEDMRMMFVVDPRVEGPSSNEPITRVFP